MTFLKVLLFQVLYSILTNWAEVSADGFRTPHHRFKHVCAKIMTITFLYCFLTVDYDTIVFAFVGLRHDFHLHMPIDYLLSGGIIFKTI